MAYKFQLGAFVASGSIKAEDGVNANSAGVGAAGAIAGATTIDGSGDLTMGTITMTGFAVDADGDVAMKSLKIDDDSTIGTDSDADMILLDPGADITIASDLDFIISKAGGLQLADGAVTSTAAELNALDGFADAGYDESADSIVFFDATDSKMKREAANDFAGAIAGNGIVASAGKLVLDGNEVSTGHAVSVPNDSFLFVDGGDNATKRDSFQNLAAGFAGNGLAASGGIIAVQVSGALAIASDKVGISGSIAGAGLKAEGGADSISELSLDLNELGAVAINVAADSFAFIDADTNNSAKESIADLIGFVAGAGLASSAGVLSVANASNGGLDVQANTIAMDIGNLAAATVDVSADSIAIQDADGAGTKKESIADLVDGIQSTGLASSGGQLSVAAAQSTITSILNNSFTTIGRGGGADELIDFSSAGSVIVKTADTARVTVTDASTTVSNNLVIAGNLTVQGSSVEVQQGFVVTSSVQFEGATPDGNEISLTSADPSADRTITLPDLDGHVPLLAGAIGSANVTAAEFALLDGGSTIATDALASGDGFLHNDGGTMKQTSVDKIADFFAGDGLASSSGVMALSIAGLANELSSATVADSDEFAISDGGTMKKIDFQHVRDSVFADVSGDAAIAAGGALTIQADAVESGMLNDNVISGQTELTSGNAVDADEMLISDGGVLKKIGLDSLKAYMSDAAADVALKDDGGTLAVGVNYFANHGGAESVTLPASAGLSVGQSIKIKAGSDCSSTNTLTVNKAGDQTIDGGTSIVLESPFAAVELVYVAADTFRVF